MSTCVYAVINHHQGNGDELAGTDATAQVSLVRYGDLAAVVGPARFQDLSSLDQEELVRSVFAHQSVIERTMQHHTVLPVKFGTMAADAEEVERILCHGQERLTHTLAMMEGKVELEVTAVWDKKEVLKDIARQADIVAFRESIGIRPSERDKVRLGQMVESCLRKRGEEIASEIVDRLAETAEDVCLHEIPDVSVVVNVAFLVSRERLEAFDRALDEADGRYGGRLTFKVVGPLPPYSFGTVVVKKAALAELDSARERLGIGRTDAPTLIKEAYWSLCARQHPDKNRGKAGAEEKFAELTRAYELLTEFHQAGVDPNAGGGPGDVVKVDVISIGTRPVAVSRRSRQ